MSGLSANFVTGTSGMSASFPGELVFGLPGEAGGYYSISVSQPDEETMRLSFHPSKNTMHPIDPVDIVLPQGPKGDPGQADEAQVRALVQEYLAQNPPTVTESDPTVPQWAKAKEKPSYTAAEVGAVSTEALPDAIDEALAQAKESGEFDGITPEFSIGTVETLDAGSNATASINGTKENPVLNLGIPQGLPGEGGTGGAQWRLCYVKLTDDVSSVTITEDIDGNPIEATEIQCYLISDFLHQNGSSVNGSIQMEINGVYIGEQFAGVLATGKPYSNIYYDAVTGEMRWVQAGLENGNGTVTGRTKAFPSETPIRSITFSWMHPDWLLKSGSEIKCWVR